MKRRTLDVFRSDVFTAITIGNVVLAWVEIRIEPPTQISLEIRNRGLTEFQVLHMDMVKGCTTARP
jgi:hypothetical protein